MAVTVVAGTSIMFHYTTSSLFNECKLLTSYRARTIMDQAGKNDWDEFTLTEGEEDFFDNCMDYVVAEIFAELAKIAVGISDSVFIDEGSVNPESGFSIADNEAYDANLLDIIEKRIRKCFVLYVIKEWWGHTALDNIWQQHEAQYNLAVREMKKKAWTLIKPLMS